MSSRNSFASRLMACLLASGFLAVAPMTNDASAGKSVRKRDSGRNFVLEMQRRGRGPRIPLPMGPSSIYYDYPYYYSRGHYPTHIGGYVYYPRNYYTRGFSRGPGSSQRPRARGRW
jgi:hypothetical protein